MVGGPAGLNQRRQSSQGVLPSALPGLGAMGGLDAQPTLTYEQRASEPAGQSSQVPALGKLIGVCNHCSYHPKMPPLTSCSAKHTSLSMHKVIVSTCDSHPEAFAVASAHRSSLLQRERTRGLAGASPENTPKKAKNL